MDFSLSYEQQEIRDWVRTFVRRELIPLEEEALRNERAGRPGVSREKIRELQNTARDAGFWGISTPVEYGGMGLDSLTSVLVAMELGRTFIPFTFGGSADNILFHADEEQKKSYLAPTLEGERISCFAITEPGAGSDARAIRTTAHRDGGDWVLNGEKTFIGHGDEADFAMVFALTDKEKGTDGGVTCFLVDRDMGWTSEPIDTMGISTSPASLIFQDVRVPASNVLGEIGKGFGLAMKWIGSGRVIIPARAVGAAERLLQMAIDYSNIRHTFGAPIADRQAIQWMIADSAVEIESAKWLTLHAAWLNDRASNDRLNRTQGRDAVHAASMAKLHGAVTANDVVDRVLQIHGGMGYTRELPIERWYRELRVLRIYEGTDEIQRRTIARNLLKGHIKLA